MTNELVDPTAVPWLLLASAKAPNRPRWGARLLLFGPPTSFSLFFNRVIAFPPTLEAAPQMRDLG